MGPSCSFPGVRRVFGACGRTFGKIGWRRLTFGMINAPTETMSFNYSVHGGSHILKRFERVGLVRFVLTLAGSPIVLSLQL